MTNEELNKKLAKWAGFKIGYMKGEGDYHCYPNSSEMYYGCIDFTSSLDACFKWLVPKIKEWCIYENGESEESEAICAEVGYYKTPKRWSGASENAATPALALCKAFEQLIDRK